MPEGHTIHRQARLQRQKLAGRQIGASSPQGRFTDGAALLDGSTLETVEAAGKHLFYRFADAPDLHVHLGLFGRFRTHRHPAPEPTAGTRLALHAPEWTIHLAGPTACELIDADGIDAIKARLGPDPIATDDGVEKLADSLGRRSIPIGAALLDQKVIAGIGNVYRAEILFLCGIDPGTPAREVPAAQVRCIWDRAVELLRRGEKSGRIVTVDPADVGGKRRSDLGGRERLYAYKRGGDACRRCGDAIAATEMGGRSIWWCPSCQSR